MSKYFVCHAGATQIPQDFTDVTGVVGELYWCADDEYARSPEECAGREDAMVAYWGIPADESDDNHERGEKNLRRRIFVDLQCFTEISEDEYCFLLELRNKITEAKTAYYKAIEKFLSNEE